MVSGRTWVAAAIAVLAVTGAASGAGTVAPAPRPKVGAPPWLAPANPMVRTRMAGLAPELYEPLTYHVHPHLDIYVNGKPLTVPAGIGINVHDPGVKSGKVPDGSLAYGGIQRCK